MNKKVIVVKGKVVNMEVVKQLEANGYRVIIIIK